MGKADRLAKKPPWKSKYSRDDLIERKFSGVALYLPEDFRLVAVDVATGRRHELHDLHYWMRKNVLDLMGDFDLLEVFDEWR